MLDAISFCLWRNEATGSIPIILEGKAGVGKSKIIEVIELFNMYQNKIGQYKQPSKKVISINKNTTLNDLMGTLQITKETAKIIPGPLKICMERGYVVLIDELNLASETIFSFL